MSADVDERLDDDRREPTERAVDRAYRARASGTPRTMTASSETGMDVAKTRNGEGPR